MLNEAMFSSKKMNWGTPQQLFDKLNDEFHFTLDPCADETNHKCAKYYTEEQNGLIMPWNGECVFCNPPYGRAISKWVKACAHHFGTAVMLIPARTDTSWFHDFIWKNPYAEIRFIRGRVKFEGATNSAPFPSMIVVFRNPSVVDVVKQCLKKQ